MPVATQAKLLRVLEDGRVRRLGGKSEIQLDVRVIAATNSPLDNAIKEGKFREDLFYRLNVFPIPLPPLRERKDDLPILAQALLEDLNRKHGTKVTELSGEVLARFADLRLAGKRPRAAQRAGARGDSGRGRNHPDRPTCRRAFPARRRPPAVCPPSRESFTSGSARPSSRPSGP